MSSRDQDDSNGIGLAVVAGVVLFIAALLFALAAFFAIVVTIFCAFAWNQPLSLGKFTLKPEDAQAIVLGGFCGAMIIPMFAVFAEMLFRMELHPDVWRFLLVGGYTLGSLGMLYVQWNQKTFAEPVSEPMMEVLPPEPMRPTVAPPPFRFASWDDEEDGR
ncbi:hypothetical protein [Roseococcus sp. YIM B11640]|uniref:hypothetical protein n=1 Tax=Roseococcus sp. YIM B11640 TaxID=3133973 RepID=UPI003C798303